MDDRLPFWTLRHRVQAWNLIFSFARCVNEERPRTRRINRPATLSPFVTQAFLYVSSFYARRDPMRPPPEGMDLFVITLAATFFTAKSSDVLHHLEIAIRLLFRAVKSMTAPDVNLLGSSSQKFPDDNIDTESLQYHRFLDIAKRAELYFLTFIDWEFIVVEPFMPFYEWLIKMDPGDQNREQFQAMRQVAVHVLCVLMVAPEQGVLDEYQCEVLAGAALTVALTRRPFGGFTADNWADSVHAEFDREAAQALADKVGHWEELLLETGMFKEEDLD